MPDKSSVDDKRVWATWKLASETVIARVGQAIARETDLSGAEYGVLSRLVYFGRGEFRQQDLADAMHWDKSRLSHQVTRMASRGLVRRRADEGRVVSVVVTAAGKKALEAARPAHARAVREHFTSRLTVAQRKLLLAASDALLEVDDDDDDFSPPASERRPITAPRR